ncbi:MAG: hypothetical protein P1V18_03050 [Candidatus Gracilibacteria bacterium]|nr:hypothetical protein [Candidatus Gracilibacteria bacterium]
MKEVREETDSERIRRTQEYKKKPMVERMVDYALRKAQLIGIKISARREVLGIVKGLGFENEASLALEDQQLSRDELDEVRSIGKEYRTYHENLESLHTRGKSLKLVRNAMHAMGYLIQDPKLPQNILLAQIIADAIHDADRLLSYSDKNTQGLEAPFVFIPSRKSIVVGRDLEIPLKDLYQEAVSHQGSLDTMKILRSTTQLYSRLYCHKQNIVRGEIKDIMPKLIEALEAAIQEETEERLSTPAEGVLNPHNILRDLSSLEVTDIEGMRYFDLAQRGKLRGERLRIYPLLMEGQVSKMLAACKKDPMSTHDILSVLGEAKEGSMEEDFDTAYKNILPSTRQYYFLNAVTSAIIMMKMVPLSAPVYEAFNAFKPKELIALKNPALGDLSVLQPFIEYLYPGEVRVEKTIEDSEDDDFEVWQQKKSEKMAAITAAIQTKYLMLLKPFRKAEYYKKTDPSTFADDNNYEREVSNEDLTYLMISIRRAFARSKNVKEALEILLPGVDIRNIIRSSLSQEDTHIADRLRLIHCHLKSMYRNHEVYRYLCDIALGDMTQHTQRSWDALLFSSTQEFADAIPETAEETAFMKSYEEKCHRVLSYARGEIVVQKDEKPLNQLSEAYNAYFLNQFVFRGHVLEHLIRRDSRVMVSSGKIEVDIQELLPFVFDYYNGRLRVLSFIADTLVLMNWQSHQLVAM